MAPRPSNGSPPHPPNLRGRAAPLKAARRAPWRAVAVGLVVAGACALPAPADACPACATGEQARSDVWNDDFGFNLVVAVLPFVLIGAISARADSLGRTRARPTGSAPTGARASAAFPP
jgi:hypothetical protein